MEELLKGFGMEIIVLKSATSPSLSNKSTLGYDLGMDNQDKVHVRITSNTASGMFSESWVAWEDVEALIRKLGDKPVTSHTLLPIFKGKSVNTAGFLLAVLRQEGVVGVAASEKVRGYHLLELSALSTALNGLQGSASVALPKAGKARSAKKPRATD